MKKFKFVGTIEEGEEYGKASGFPYPEPNKVYQENTIFSSEKVWRWANKYRNEWQEVFDEQVTTSDPVNPQHYKNGEVECIDGIRSAVVGKDGFAGYLTGNVIKYIWRYESKGGVQDLEKASWYLNKLIEHEKGKVK